MDQNRMYTVDDFLQNIRFVEWVENPRPEDDLYWKQWLEEHPQAAKSMERAIEWIRSWSSDNKFLPETYYTNLKNRIDQTIQAQEASRFQWPFRAFLKIAAVLAGLILLVFFFYTNGKRQVPVTFHTAYGEIRTVRLPDGSEVTLYANTKLRYTSGHRSEREVWLAGEAAFKVKHVEKNKQALKFIVHSGDVDVEVLGTRFMVNNTETDPTFLLLDGKVRVREARNAGNSILLRPNEQADYHSTEKNFSLKIVDPSVSTAWMRRQYVLQKTPVYEICRRLASYYGKQWRIEEAAIAEKKVSGTLELQDHANVIQTLSTLLDATITANDSVVIIHSK